MRLKTNSETLVIRNAVVAYSQSLLIAADKVLVISYVNASTAMETVVLSTSGTTITVNTAVATTLAGNFVYSANLITVGTSFVAVYARATSITGLRAITVSGTVPTVGAEVANAYNQGGGSYLQLFVSGSVVRLVVTTATLITVNPYTVSGVTLTAGTAATANSSAALTRMFQNAAGNIVCLYLNTVLTAAIFKLTGTTEAVSTVALHESLGGSNPTTLNAIDFYTISATKTGIIFGNASYIANILVDTTGTASAGTEITGVGAFTSLSTFSTTTANTMKAGFFGTSAAQIHLFDCSGTSLTLTSSTLMNPVQTGASSLVNYMRPLAGGAIAKGSITKISYNQLVIGDTSICTGAYSYGMDSIFTKNGLILNSIPNFGLNVSTPTVAGINTNQSWAIAISGAISTLIQVDGAGA